MLNTVGVNERVFESFLHREDDHDASQNVDFDEGLETESHDFQLARHRLDFEYGLSLSIVVKNLLDMRI